LLFLGFFTEVNGVIPTSSEQDSKPFKETAV
jgi:hypothetical protein